ncbi:MAG: hypothetical protein DMG97_28240 [Acidobacteria bacterium]|nr:MAG: hypothetical protein DMG97_28240 [Acidobacteriota bacterium]
MKHPYTLSLAVGIGAVAGLRPMTAPAVIAWAARRKWIHLGSSPFVTIISARASRTITELAISELIADKLPFTPSRLNPGPLASRIASGAVCGAAVCGAVKRPFVEGALLGGLGAIAGALAGYHVRKRLSRETPDFAVGLLEDALSNRRRRGHNRTDGECQIAPFISGGE